MILTDRKIASILHRAGKIATCPISGEIDVAIFAVKCVLDGYEAGQKKVMESKVRIKNETKD